MRKTFISPIGINHKKLFAPFKKNNYLCSSLREIQYLNLL